jgi:hypothetical protein
MKITITPQNYNKHIETLDFSTLPADYKEAFEVNHSLVNALTNNGLDWSKYLTAKEEIKEPIRMFFEDLSEYLNTQEQGKQEIKKDKKETSSQTTGKMPQVNSGNTVFEKPKKSALTVVKEKPERKDPPATTSGALQVGKISEDVKFIREYLKLDGTYKTKAQILNFLTKLQRAMYLGNIGLQSLYGKHIIHMQGELLKAYRIMDMEKHRAYPIKIDEERRGELEEIAESQIKRPSVALLEVYSKLQGTAEREASLKLLGKMESSIGSGEISKDDPYYSQVEEAIEYLRELRAGDADDILELTTAELHGLGCPGKNSQLSSINCIGNNSGPAMSLGEARNKRYKRIGLTGDFRRVIGDACMPTSILLSGSGGDGKTTWMLLFAHNLIQLGYRVLYAAFEQYNSPTFLELTGRLGIPDHQNLTITGTIVMSDPKKNPGNYDFIFLDSKDAGRVTVDMFRALKSRFTLKSFVLSSQGTKEGKFRGSGEWQNEVDTVLEAKSGVIQATSKNRWGGKEGMRVY